MECEKYDWCRGFRVKEKNTISCRLLTNKYAEMEGWTLFNKGNWVEPENWRGSIWANASNSHYKCYEKVGSGDNFAFFLKFEIISCKTSSHSLFKFFH